MSGKRRDSKNRILRSGENQRKDGRYAYKYTDTFGKPPLNITVFPKGQKHNHEILKHCLLIGIPITVMAHKTPAIPQRMPVIAPPKTNQTRFLSILIKCHTPLSKNI